MLTKIAKWGNSKAIRIPKEILEEINLKNGDDVTIDIEDGCIIISPKKQINKIDLDALFKTYEGDDSKEFWTDNSVGKEVW